MLSTESGAADVIVVCGAAIVVGVDGAVLVMLSNNANNGVVVVLDDDGAGRATVVAAGVAGNGRALRCRGVISTVMSVSTRVIKGFAGCRRLLIGIVVV